MPLLNYYKFRHSVLELEITNLRHFYTNTAEKSEFPAVSFCFWSQWEKSCFTTSWKQLGALQWSPSLFVFNAKASRCIHPSIHQGIKWPRKQCRFSSDPIDLFVDPLRWKVTFHCKNRSLCFSAHPSLWSAQMKLMEYSGAPPSNLSMTNIHREWTLYPSQTPPVIHKNINPS